MALVERLFQPTLPARGATHRAVGDARLIHISTHAPRTGSDAVFVPREHQPGNISTHAPRTGSDVS